MVAETDGVEYADAFLDHTIPLAPIGGNAAPTRERNICIRLKEAALVWARGPRWFQTNATLGMVGSGLFPLRGSSIYIHKSYLYSVYLNVAG